MFPLISLADPRYGTIYNLSGTEGTRLSSQKIFRTFGGNNQNWNKSIRHQIVADDDKDLCQIDQAGADALVVAWECEDGNLRALFREGIKPHIYVALHLFASYWIKEIGCYERDFQKLYLDVPIAVLPLQRGWKELCTLIKSHDKYYFLGKKTCHSCNYGMFAKTFVLAIIKETEGQIIITVQEGERFINTYHRIFPEVKRWQSEIDVLIRKQPPILYDLFGYPFYVTSNINDMTERAAYSAIPRNTVGTITNIAFTEIYNRLHEPLFEGVDLLQNGHDSILLQGPSSRIQEIGGTARKHMERDLVSTKGEKFKMKTGIGYGKNWGPWSEENPEGIREI